MKIMPDFPCINSEPSVQIGIDVHEMPYGSMIAKYQIMRSLAASVRKILIYRSSVLKRSSLQTTKQNIFSP